MSPGEPHDILERILEEGPSQHSLVLILSRMSLEGHHQEVIRQAVKGLRLFPEDLRLRLLLAEAYLHVGFIGLAEGEFIALRARLRPLASAYRRLAQFFSKTRMGAEAENAFRQYLAMAPDDSDAQARIPLSDPDKAAEGLEETSGLTVADPSRPDEPFVTLATPTLAELYYTQGQINLALETYGKVLEKNPGDEASKKRLSEIRSMKAKTSEGQQRPLSPPRTRFMIHVLETWRRRIEGREGD